MTLEHWIEWEPAYDKRPKYGLHGVTCRWYSRGPEGVIQFVIYTNWQLPNVRDETRAREVHDPMFYIFYEPMAADIGYHARTPQYEGQEQWAREDCELLGGTCY